jgi:hypothetical protein
MKFVTGHVISFADMASAVIVLALLAAWAVLALWTIRTLRHADQSGVRGALWGGGLVLGSVLLMALLFGRTQAPDTSAERRAIEARATELAARAIAPGSALACLDAVASAPVEAACEKALFATSESVAAALAYVNAQYSLLVAGAALAERDPGYAPAVERLRRGIEQDRFGFAAQVLSTRGCNTPDCADLAVLRDAKRILANMKDSTFAARVEAHALAWSPDGPVPVFAAASPAVPAPAETPAASLSHRRYDYPSANSIPPVSIMESETDPPPTVADRKAEPPKRPALRPRAAREQPPAAGAPPTAIVPQTATSGSR